MKIEGVELVVTTDIGIVRVDIPWKVPGLIMLDHSIGSILNQEITKLVNNVKNQ